MIVLHEDDGVGTAFHLLEHGACAKRCVDALVALPVAGAEDGPGVRDVTERPQPFIGEAVVVARLFFF